MCAYPNNKKHLKKRKKYLETSTPSKTSWPLCVVEIISTTDTLEKGKRRLARAETTLQVDTDRNSISHPQDIEQLSNDKIKNEFSTERSMSSSIPSFQGTGLPEKTVEEKLPRPEGSCKIE